MSMTRSLALAFLLGFATFSAVATRGEEGIVHTLSSLVQAALATNSQLEAARHVREAAHHNVDVQEAPLLPSVGADWRTGRERSRRHGTVPLSSEEHRRTYGLSLQQRLLSLPARYNYRSSIEGARAADADFETELSRVVLEVGLTWLTLHASLDRLDFLHKRQGRVSVQLDIASQLLTEGAARKPDVIRVDARLRSVGNQIRTEEQRVTAATGTLARLTGVGDFGKLPRLGQDQHLPGPRPVEAWIRSAAETNPGLRAATRRVEETRLAYVSANSGHIPEIAAVARKEWGDDADSLFYGFQVTFPLVDGWGTSARANQAWSLHSAAKEQLTATEQAIIESIRSSHSAVLAHIANASAMRETVSQLEENLEVITGAWRNGHSTIDDVLTAEEELFEAQTDWRSEQYGYLGVMLQLHSAAGTLNEQSVEAISNRFDD